MNCELSVIVLCYRAEENIIPFVGELKKLLENLACRWEIVLVGNYVEGSSDRTKDIVLKLAAEDGRIKAIAEAKKGMMGWDMRKGLLAATGEYLCVIDGDGQFPLESITECFKLITEKDLDLVKTYRIKRHDGFYRTAISGIYNFVFRLLFPGINTIDINSKPKVLKKTSFDRMELKSDDWFIDAEIMLNIGRLKMSHSQIPVVFRENHRPSFVKFRAIFEFLKNLVIYRIKEWGR